MEIWVKDSYNKTARIPAFIYSIDIHTYIYIYQKENTITFYYEPTFISFYSSTLIK